MSSLCSLVALRIRLQEGKRVSRCAFQLSSGLRSTEAAFVRSESGGVSSESDLDQIKSSTARRAVP